MSEYVLVVGDGYSYYQPFRQFGKFTRDQAILKQPEKVSLVVFTGGADVTPALYGHKPSRLTFCTSRRDVFEMLAFRQAYKNKLRIAGICRGAQFLCVMAGGSLFQHVEGHACSAYHSMRLWDGRVLNVTSTHHQMQNPPQDSKILAWSDKKRSDIYIGEDDEEVEAPRLEYECVHYPKINAVSMQYHPEAMHENSEGFRLAGELVGSFLKSPKIAI